MDEGASELIVIAEWARRLRGAEPVSAGWNCNTAHYLQAVGARRAAYPFDWIFTSPKIIAHLIDARFEDFLEPSSILGTARSAPGTCAITA